MDHPISIRGYDSLEELAKDIVNLRYDAQMQLNKHIVAAIQDMADRDLASGKRKLAKAGYQTAQDYINAYDHLRVMMNISRKHMSQDLEKRPEIK